MTKKTETFIDLSKVPDEHIKATDSFMISALLRDTLQLIGFLARARKMPARGTENQLGFYTGDMYDTFLREHVVTMKRHVKRQSPAVVNSGKVCPLRWSFEAPTAVKKLFADAGTHVSWFTIESHITIKGAGKVKPMVTYGGVSTLIYNEPFKPMRVVEYISKLNATGGLPERVNKLEEIVAGLSKSVIYATNKPEDRAAPAWQEVLLKFLDGPQPQPRSWEETFKHGTSRQWNERMFERFERGERLTSAQWREMFNALDKIPLEEAVKVVKYWVETFSEVTYTAAYADWSAMHAGVLLNWKR